MIGARLVGWMTEGVVAAGLWVLDRVAGPLEPDDEADDDERDDEPDGLRESGESGVAQRQDHSREGCATPAEEATEVAQPEKPNEPAARLLGGPRIDGGTSWAVTAGPHGFRCWPAVRAALKHEATALEWVDSFGELVSLAIDRGSPGSGRATLYTSRVRVEIAKGWAEIQITAEAAEVEGVDAWFDRELPRWMTWLGVEVEQVEQKRLELCLDVAGWQLKAGDERAMVSAAAKTARWRGDGGLDGFGAGKRSSTPSSLEVYDKLAKLGSQRAPAREALMARWAEAGREGDEPVTRVELRLQGEALRMVAEDGKQLDATRPGAALDGELLGKLWADGLTKHRLVDVDSDAKRVRDKPELELWARARAAGGVVEAVKLRRDLAARQLDTTRSEAMRRLGRAGADVEVLLGGKGSGRLATGALRLLTTTWGPEVTRAQARYGDLLRDAKDDGEDQ